jgi:hypothetical protein
MIRKKNLRFHTKVRYEYKINKKQDIENYKKCLKWKEFIKK